MSGWSSAAKLPSFHPNTLQFCPDWRCTKIHRHPTSRTIPHRCVGRLWFPWFWWGRSKSSPFHPSTTWRNENIVDFCARGAGDERRETTNMWNGSQVMLVIHLEWPRMTCPICFPLFTSHAMTNPSMPPDTTVFPSGDHEIQSTQLVWAFSVYFGISVIKSHTRTLVSPKIIKISKSTRSTRQILSIWTE